MDEHSKLKEFLQSIADNVTVYDDEDNYLLDIVGTDINDCYSRGLDDGEVSLAREILAEFFSKENDEPT